MTKELEGLKEGSKSKIHINLLKTTLKNQIGKRQTMMEHMDSGIHLHSRQTSTKNEKMPARSTCTRMDDQRKDHIDPEGPPQWNRPKQLPTHNLPSDDVENINSTNKGRNLQLANKLRIVPWRIERMPQRIQRQRRVSLYTSAHPQRELDLTEKSSYGQDWRHMILSCKAG